MFEGVLDFFRRNRHVNRASRAAPVLVASGAPGELVRIAGRVEIDELALVSPFAKRKCVHYRARLEEKHTSDDYNERGELKNYWTDAFVVEERVPFWLVDDAGGRVRVRRDPIDHDLRAENVSEAPTVNDENAEFSRFLRRQGVLSILYMGIAGDHRFWETRIDPGERLSIYGRVAVGATTTSTGYRDAPVALHELAGTEVEPLVIRRG